MLLAVTRGSRWRNGATSVSWHFARLAHLAKQVAEAGLHEGPSALVLRLFLYPFDLSVAVTLKRWLDVSEGEWGNLLDSYDSDILDATLGSLSLEVVVDLTTAEEHFLDLAVSNHLSGCLLNDSLESEANFEIFYLRASSTILQELLGDWNNQWLSKWSSNLPPEQVEVLGSSGAVAKTEVHSFDNLRLWHIISGWLIVSIVKLKESLDTARRVLWASTVISVRQEHDET